MCRFQFSVPFVPPIVRLIVRLNNTNWLCIASLASAIIGMSALRVRADEPDRDKPRKDETQTSILQTFVRSHCLDCHSADSSEGDLDLSELSSKPLEGQHLAIWTKVHDRVLAGEMPPKAELTAEQTLPFTTNLFTRLVELDKRELATSGRAVWRRMNRYEYENTLRDLLGAPWLQLKTMLPEDGEQKRFNKIGEALDVSHVNMARYMQAAEYALRQVKAQHTEKPEAKTDRYYAREQTSFTRKVHYTEFNRSPERATFPLIEYDADIAVLRDEKHPFTVGDKDAELREREAFGVVASSYEPIETRFNAFKAPEAGRYKLRFKGYTFWAAGEEKKWWRPDREKTSRGRRSEPVAVYAVSPPRQLRKLGEFDFDVEPTVRGLDVYLLEGESIQTDAVRLFRSRPSNWHNPLAEKDGMPGVAYNYMEAEGPIYDEWPTRGATLLFGDLPLVKHDRNVTVVSHDPQRDAERLLKKFLSQAYRRPVQASEVERFMTVINFALQQQMSFEDAMLAGYTAVLCSPEFICLQEPVGQLDDAAIATRMSLFLWNSQPDAALRELAEEGKLQDKSVIRQQVARLLDDNRSRQFVDAFLAYWLDLRKINDTSPDERMYPDYYLDDALVDAALAETQLYFQELVREDLPARLIVDSDFTFANERLAQHYRLPEIEGVAMRRVALPESSPRGGLLTQASVLKVTANGTTTSPVVRGAWVNERILGIQTPPPPKSVPAIEPDTRGATTIRQQLLLHRADTSCNGCHAIIDPVGFALESFDVAGGWRERYRSLGESGEAVEGFGKNGQPFTFRHGPEVDASGNLPSGEKFADIFELKKLLAANQRGIAKNLLHQLVIYATGAPIRFSDRVEVEQILDRLANGDYRLKSMITEIVASDMFLKK